MSKKKCSNCELELPLSKFVRRKFNSGNWGYTSWCKPCRNKKSKEDWKDGKIRDSVYKRKFGISLKDYDDMLKKQDGKCAICKTKDPEGHGKKYKRFSIDHNHETGDVRGLLCVNCNLALGGFKDSIKNLLNAIEYLKNN